MPWIYSIPRFLCQWSTPWTSPILAGQGEGLHRGQGQGYRWIGRGQARRLGHLWSTALHRLSKSSKTKIAWARGYQGTLHH